MHASLYVYIYIDLPRKPGLMAWGLGLYVCMHGSTYLSPANSKVAAPKQYVHICKLGGAIITERGSHSAPY